MRWEARKFLADLERCRKLNRYGGFDIELLEKECLFGTAVIFLAIFTVSRLYFFSSEKTDVSMIELIESVLEVLESPKMKDRALASFMERPKNTGTALRHIKERNLKRLRKARSDEERYGIICDIYRLPCLLEMSKKE